MSLILTSRESGDVFLSVVIPAYNEESRIGSTIAKIRVYLSQQAFSYEIMVVDDGSRDKTVELALKALEDLPDYQVLSLRKNCGKGYSVREGMLRARGQTILFSDADLSTPIEELGRFLPWLEQEYEIVIGSRALPDSDIQVRQSLLRESMGKIFNVFVRLLFLPDIKDTQCGFKLFSRDAARMIFPLLCTSGFSFDVEALVLAHKLGYRIKQVPIVWRNSGQSKVKIISSSLKMFFDLCRIWFLGEK